MRRYLISDCAAFLRTSEVYGAFSNMASGFAFPVGDAWCRSSEAYCQAMRFPDHPDVQREILSAATAKAAKIISRANGARTCPGWAEERINILVMRHALRLRLAFHPEPLRDLYEASGDRPIVELSYRDTFWGALPDGRGHAIGQNILGRLHMELRQEIREDPARYRDGVPSPARRDLRLIGHPLPEFQPAEAEARQGSLGL